MKTNYQNWADKDLTVHSLKILGNVEGGGITEIRRSVDSVKKQTMTKYKEQEQYWKDLSADGIVSAVEKQSLRREMENIRRSYSAVIDQATSLGYSSPILQDFIDTYNALHTYVFETLKLFDDMEKDSPLDSRETFNTMFSNYFFEESYIMLAISEGILEAIDIRVLSSLEEQGEEDELAIYHGGFYQFVDGHWKSITTGNYKGPRDSTPAPEENSFFIASDNFSATEVLIVNGEEFYVNGEQFLVKHVYKKGFIYYCQDDVWYVENDKRNWRYNAAFADVINITGELPQIFQDGLDSIQANLDAEILTRQGQYTIIDGQLVQINSDISNLRSIISGAVTHLPQYYGARDTNPNNPQEGDFYVWSGGTYGDRENSKVYVYRSGTWVGLDPTVTANRDYYMMALSDVLACNNTANGYFAAIFANSFFANDATLNSLETQKITLRSGGNIQSADIAYSPENSGFKIGADGNADFNGNTHIKGKVAIGVPLSGNTDFSYYDVVIGGNTKISGTLAGANGTFTGNLQAVGGTFKGELTGVKGSFTGPLWAAWVDDMSEYALIASDGTIALRGVNFNRGIFQAQGFLQAGYRTHYYNKYHPTSRDSLIYMMADIANDLNTYAGWIGNNLMNRVFRNDDYVYLAAGGTITVYVNGGVYTLTVTHVGIYRTSNTLIPHIGQVFGYMADQSYLLYWNTGTEMFGIYRISTYGASNKDTGNATLIATVTGIGSASIYVG